MRALGRFLPPMTAKRTQLVGPAMKSRPSRQTAAARADRTGAAATVAPVGALVNDQGDILYLHGRTGLYLEPAPGEAGVNNILKMAREGLRRELTTALHKAAAAKRPSIVARGCGSKPTATSPPSI